MRANTRTGIVTPRDRNAFVTEHERGATTLLKTKTTESATLSGATSTVTGAVPAGSLLLGISMRVLVAVTGATSIDVGDGVDADLYGDNVGITVGTTSKFNNHTANPVKVVGAAAADVVLTGVGGSFTAGKVAITAHYIEIGPQTA